MEAVLWFLIGANVMGWWMLLTMFLHRPTQRKWLAVLKERLGED